MWTVRTSVLALILLSACDGNPLDGGGDGGGGGGGGGTNVSVSSLPGTNSPTAEGDILRREAKVEEAGEDYGNGFAEDMTYNEGDDTFSVNNLAFDGDNVYDRDDTRPTNGIAQVYEADSTYADDETGALIDQFSHRALYGESSTGRSKFAIVRTGAYIPFGFGGFVFSRDGNVVLPTGGQAHFAGEYSGLRDFNGAGGLQYVTGDMTMDIDFDDFDPDESSTGNGASIDGRVFNRRVFDLSGNDITADILTEINDDKDATLTELPTLVFGVGPGLLDNNGEAEGTLSSAIVASGTLETLESGNYYAVISGEGDDQEVVGIIVVKSTVNDVTVRETGGFILYR